MKKIFIGENTLFLCGDNGAKKIKADHEEQGKSFNMIKIKREEEVFENISQLESGLRQENLIVVGNSAINLEKYFFSLYKQVDAAGGAVLNLKDQLLMIYRRKKWDLPKGKVDKGESVKQAALREIREETGISDLKIKSVIKFLFGRQNCTYHTYELNGIKIIKATYWFRMKSGHGEKLIPQQEEDIEKAEWCDKEKTAEYLQNSFHSIEDVVREAFRK